MTGFRLTKHHGLGNDFLVAVVDAPAPDGDDGTNGLDAERARSWCDRRRGIGADGLIVATPAADDGGRRWRMVLWNADGGRAEISGNGLRCLGQALARHLGLDPTADQDLMIETDAGARPVVVLGHSGRAEDVMVQVGMGKAVEGPAPSDRWAELGVAVEAQVGVDIGNPHLVAFVDSLDAVDMGVVGPAVEADHPGGLNVHAVSVVDRGRLDLLVWERGAGLTEACGSGACAAAWAAHHAGLVDAAVTVSMPGGSARVALGDDEILLTGPATFVAEIRPAGGELRHE